jgi:hypothetical protein
MRRRAFVLSLIVVTLLGLPAWAAVVPPPTVPQSGSLAPPSPGYVADTENLTQVANAISMQQKSLSILVTAKSGLVLTSPVTITVTYQGPATNTPDNTGFKQLVEPYAAQTGNRFLFNALETDGKPRPATVHISLLEPKPGGGSREGHAFYFPEMRLNLDPLYDVATSPLDFTLGDNCGPAGESQVGLHWYSPEGTDHSENFSASAGKTVTFPQFAWKRAEVSASANLTTPAVGFWKRGPGTTQPNFTRSKANLVPGKTRTIRAHEVSGQCRALIEYTITYRLFRLDGIRVPPTGGVNVGGAKP